MGNRDNQRENMIRAVIQYIQIAIAIIVVVLMIVIVLSEVDNANEHKSYDISTETTLPVVRQTLSTNYDLVKTMTTENESTTEKDVVHESTTQTTARSQYNSTEKIEEDYYYARVIWNYLRYEMGLNKWCAAGIMGNIMTECGGQTLNIQPYITNSSGHYGICQWNLKYFPEVKGKNIHGQLEFLNSTLRWILNDYGDRYYDGFNYEKFIAITNEREAAKAFAHGYEGCGEYCAPRRLDHATEALKYFEGE